MCTASPLVPIAFGFGAGVPYTLPDAWEGSFSYLSAEAFLSPHLTAALDVGVYPYRFPDLLETSAALHVKSWLGPVCLFAGGGMTLQAERFSAAWALRPRLSLRGGVQLWPLDSLAINLQIRTQVPIPPVWTFEPDMSLGFLVALRAVRPDPFCYDVLSLWLIVGLAVAASLAFLPRL